MHGEWRVKSRANAACDAPCPMTRSTDENDSLDSILTSLNAGEVSEIGTPPVATTETN